MKIWICHQCHAEIPQEKKPELCPLCGGIQGFDEGFREDKKKTDDDKRIDKLYEDALKELEEYDKGCEPEELKFHCEC